MPTKSFHGVKQPNSTITVKNTENLLFTKYNKMKAIYRLNFDAGRMGSLAGIFVSEKQTMEKLIASGKDVEFGEVLGKHSEISGPIEAGDIEFISDDPAVVEMFEKHNMATGYDPFDYITDEMDEDDSGEEE